MKGPRTTSRRSLENWGSSSSPRTPPRLGQCWARRFRKARATTRYSSGRVASTTTASTKLKSARRLTRSTRVVVSGRYPRPTSRGWRARARRCRTGLTGARGGVIARGRSPPRRLGHCRRRSAPRNLRARGWPGLVEDLFADVAVLVAPGGTGKTTLMLYEAAHIVLGRPLYGLAVRRPGPVLIVTAEDSREMLVARLRAIVDALVLTPPEVARVLTDVRISDVSGRPLKLTRVQGEAVEPAGTVDEIIEAARALAPALVVIDPAVSFGIGEARVNDAEQGLVEAARRIRKELNTCVRYVHHVGKANARDSTLDQYSGRGGSAMPDGARMVTVLQPLDASKWQDACGESLLDGEIGLVLARPKLSYVPPMPDILLCRKGYVFRHRGRAVRTREEELAGNCDQVARLIEAECAAGRFPRSALSRRRTPASSVRNCATPWNPCWLLTASTTCCYLRYRAEGDVEAPTTSPRLLRRLVRRAQPCLGNPEAARCAARNVLFGAPPP